MIVKHCEEGWEIISHYAHGLLSGKIASQLKQKWMPEHWVDVLTGIIEHDDHLLDFEERNYLTENGTPRDFTMEGGTDSETVERAERVFANAMQKSQMVALLTGRHLGFLYEKLAEDHAPMKKFLKDIKDLRKGQRKLYGLNQKDENHLYDLMLFSDRCSLILCQDKIPAVGRKIEINKTIENERYYLSRKEDDSLTIEPWPFEKSTFQLTFEIRILDRPTYKNNKELEEALDKAEIRMRVFTLKE